MRLFTPRKRGKKGQPSSYVRPGKGMILGYSALGVLIMFSIGALASGFGIPAQTVGRWYLFEVAGITEFLLMFIGSVFYAMTAVFDSKDNDLLLSMPIKPGDIVISRLVTLILLNAFFGFTVFIPFAVVGIIQGVINAPAFFLFLAGTLLLIFLTMAAVSFFAWIISLILSKVKRKQIVQTALLLVGVAAYVIIYPNISKIITAGITDPVSAGEKAKVIYPFYIFGKGCDGDLLFFAAFIAISAFAVLAAYWLMRMSFIRIITSKVTVQAKAYTGKAKQKVRSPKNALIVKEIKRFTGSAVYMANAGLGLLFMIAFGIYTLVSGTFAEVEKAIGQQQGSVIAIMTAVLSAISAMTMISAPSVSLEGKSLWILRSAPVGGKTVLTAKSDAHIVIAAPFIAVSCLICGIAAKDVIGALLAFAAVLAATAVMAHVGVVFNTLFPRFDNESDTHTIKRSGAVLLSMVAGMVFTGVSVAIALPAYFGLGAYAATAVFTAVNLIAAAVLRAVIVKSMSKRFDSFDA